MSVLRTCSRNPQAIHTPGPPVGHRQPTLVHSLGLSGILAARTGERERKRQAERLLLQVWLLQVLPVYLELPPSAVRGFSPSPT